MFIANRLFLTRGIKAILWDMDGVLIDSLGFDIKICNELIHKHLQDNMDIPSELIRSLFAYDPRKFWGKIFEYIKRDHAIPGIEDHFDSLLHEYTSMRKEAVFELNKGIRDILKGAKRIGIKMVVVSNNPTEDVKKILIQSGILEYFDLFIGNDIIEFEKKPAPDTYQYAANFLALSPAECVVIEDTILGAEAGNRAGCYTVGVATGGDTFLALNESRWTDMTYSSFEKINIEMAFGDVCNKVISTPNDFISHMIEHIAWRVGLEVNICWNNDNWSLLGFEIGDRIRKFPLQGVKAAALGMIDDGSSEAIIDTSSKPETIIESIENLDLEWFFTLRCEQLSSAEPLIFLMDGLSKGLHSKLYVRVCSIEDPHHTWEGIYRAIGILLRRLYRPKDKGPDACLERIEKEIVQGDVNIEERGINRAKVSRRTAESRVTVQVDFNNKIPFFFKYDIKPSINCDGLDALLKAFAKHAGFSLQIDFKATRLSSSHVVLEDTGLVLGRALREVFIMRMREYGINGAGSSLATPEDIQSQPIRVGISVEGRKFCKMVPFSKSYDDLKRDFIIGQNIFNNLYSEDLDDFLDGLSEGLLCSIMIHIEEVPGTDEGWRMIFENLGIAVREAFSPNSSMKGLPPGVKATLS